MRIRLLILLIGFIGLSLFILQNREPIALVFFGSQITFQFPLGIWILLFLVAGFFTSLVLQLLFRSFPRTSTPPLESEEPVAPRFERRYQEQSSQSDRRRSESAADSSWESQDDDEWNIEEPPTQTTNTREQWERRLRKEEDLDQQDEQVPQPKSVYRSGSVYSYGYRDSGNTGVGKTEPVYDANYRVINPPLKEKVEEQKENNKGEDEDEDWI